MKKKLLTHIAVIMGILSILELLCVFILLEPSKFEGQLVFPLLSIGTTGILISLLIFLHIFVFKNWRGTEE